MSNYTGLDDGDGVRSAGANILASADDYSSKIVTHNANLDGLEAGAPWGDDEYGEAFKKNYMGSDGKGHDHTDTRKSAADAGARGVKIGNGALHGATDIQVADLEGQLGIEQVGKSTQA
jgi:hypothetical protein